MANEKRLIDANALYIKLGKLAREPDYQHEGEDWGVGVAMSMGEVWSEPTVDAVEVVRCKDCKHYDNSEGICWCHLNSKFFPGGVDWHGFPEDGFCSYGERKDNG